MMADVSLKSANRESENPDRLQQYGVLPWRKSRQGGIEVLMITSRERGRWLFPKGWPMNGKSPLEAASQEAFEEAGVFGDVNPYPVGSYDYVKVMKNGSEADCTVQMFALAVRGTLTHWPERHQRKRRWHRINEAAAAASDEDLSSLLQDIDWDRKLLG
ncbi:MAG: NUDIX hydrolase [Phyllobacterium sp.]